MDRCSLLHFQIKPGYRIYFPYLFIDNGIHSKYMKEISQYFQKTGFEEANALNNLMNS
jgi:hypothetical protein